MEINLNQRVRFKPNQRGLNALLEEGYYFCVQIDGYCEMALHDFVRVFGKHMGVDFNGSTVEGNTLIVVED